MPKVVSYKQLPLVLALEKKHIKRAGVKTLNTIAFDSLPEITKQASRDMNFTKSPRNALNFRIMGELAKMSQPEPTVGIWTNRGWLFYHLDKGRRDASSGWRFQGKDYILVPVDHSAFTKKKRLRAKYRRALYIIEDGSDALVFYRPRRGSRKSELIAVLKPQVDYNEDTEPDKVIQRVFREKANRLFKFHLNKARR